MLLGAAFEIVADAGIEDAGGVGHDIDMVNHGENYVEIILGGEGKGKRGPSTTVGMTAEKKRETKRKRGSSAARPGAREKESGEWLVASDERKARNQKRPP